MCVCNPIHPAARAHITGSQTSPSAYCMYKETSYIGSNQNQYHKYSLSLIKPKIVLGKEFRSWPSHFGWDIGKVRRILKTIVDTEHGRTWTHVHLQRHNIWSNVQQKKILGEGWKRNRNVRQDIWSLHQTDHQLMVS